MNFLAELRKSEDNETTSLECSKENSNPKDFPPSILNPRKIFFKNEGKIKMFSAKENLRAFVRNVQQRNVKDSSLSGRKITLYGNRSTQRNEEC